MPKSKYLRPTPETLTSDFLDRNKQFYRNDEEYDWVEATDHVIGLETFFHRLRQHTILSLLKKHAAGEPYLDAACGTGLFLRHLPPGSTGIDINPRNIEKARVHAPSAKLVVGDLESLPFPDASFSTILLTEILEHLPNPKIMLSEIWRVLQPGGVIIGSTPRHSMLWRLRMLSSTCPGEPFHREFNRTELQDTLAGFGTTTIRLEHLGMSWIFIMRK